MLESPRFLPNPRCVKADCVRPVRAASGSIDCLSHLRPPVLPVRAAPFRHHTALCFLLLVGEVFPCSLSALRSLSTQTRNKGEWSQMRHCKSDISDHKRRQSISNQEGSVGETRVGLFSGSRVAERTRGSRVKRSKTTSRETSLKGGRRSGSSVGKPGEVLHPNYKCVYLKVVFSSVKASP